jgi:hypothetical protein
MEHIVVLLVNLGQNRVFVHVLIVKLKTLAPSWAVFDAPAHLTFAPTWEK